MKNTIIISAAAMLFFTTSQMCGCGCKVNGQTLASNEIVKSEPQTVTLKVTGMTCSGCSNHISTALSKTEGIISQEVKYPGDMATVKYDPDKISEKEIIDVIVKTGYKAEVMKDELKKEEGKSETKPEKKCDTDCKKSCCSKKKGGC